MNTNTSEMKAFIGIHITVNLLPYTIYWSKALPYEAADSVMSKTGFEIL